MNADKGGKALVWLSHLCLSVFICGQMSPRFHSASLRVLRGESCVFPSAACRLASVRRGTRTRRDRDGRRRGRVVVGVGVYLLLGWLLTWVVAWTAAAAVSPWDHGDQFEVFDTERANPQVVSVYASFGATSAAIYFDASSGLSHARATRPAFNKNRELPGFARNLVPGISLSDSTGTFAIHATGWPWRACAFALDNQRSDNHQMLILGRDIFPIPPPGLDPNPTGALRLTGGYLPTSRFLPDNELWFPYLPLWRGLIASTLFYALLVWLLRRGFVFVRGWHRRRKGRCGWRGGCGYDLSGSVGEVCPECGRPVGEGGGGKATAEVAE